jgi:hypothetical protein
VLSSTATGQRAECIQRKRRRGKGAQTAFFLTSRHHTFPCLQIAPALTLDVRNDLHSLVDHLLPLARLEILEVRFIV